MHKKNKTTLTTFYHRNDNNRRVTRPTAHRVAFNNN